MKGVANEGRTYVAKLETAEMTRNPIMDKN